MKHVTAPLLLFFALFCTLCLVVPSCGGVDCKDPANASTTKCVAQQSVIDCTAPDVMSYVVAHAEDVAKCFRPLDWACLETALVHLAATDAYCVLEHEFDHYLATGEPTVPADAGVAGSGASPAAVRVALPPSEPEALIAKKQALAAKLWPGKSVKK